MSGYDVFQHPVCVLCGVPFNLGRLRMPHEPAREGYAWSSVDGARLIVTCGEPESVCALSHHRDPMTREHISSPGVEYRFGYNGYNITKEEMRGALQVQCLQLKSTSPHMEGYVPVPMPDNALNGFEAASESFVSGVSLGPPNVEGHVHNGGAFYVGGLKPVRFGRTCAWIGNRFTDESIIARCGVPFHPACFEIFKRVSAQRSGTADIDGLYWLVRNQRESSMPRAWDVDDCLGIGNWRHLSGTEYLATNPVDIPGLSEILINLAMESERECSTYISARGHPKPPLPSDPFYRLPQELRDNIVIYLPPSSILSLRLCSRSFDRLPSIYFEHLVRTEMPFVWELSPNEGNILREAMVRKERLWSSKLSTRRHSIHDRRESNQELAMKNHEITLDWFRLYTALKCRLIPGIKGLRNRRRIWRDVERIVILIEGTWRERGLM